MATGEFWATCVAHVIFLLDITGLKVKPLEPEVVANFIWTRISFPSALEKEMATHSSILAWRIPWTERGAWRATVHGVSMSQTEGSWHTRMHWSYWVPWGKLSDLGRILLVTSELIPDCAEE